MSIIQKPLLGQDLYIKPEWAKGLVGYWLMNEGSGNIIQDLSGNGHVGTLAADTHWTSGKFGPALKFDGVGDYVVITGSNVLGTKPLELNDSFTISLWTNLTSNISCYLVNTHEGEGIYQGQHTTIHVDPSGANVTIEAAIDDNVDPTTLLGGVLILGQWYHIVLVRDKGATLKLYVNGIENVSAADITTGSILSDEDWTFGARAHTPSTEEVVGSLDNISFYNRAFSASETQDLYINSFAMFERDPIELWTGAMGGAPPAGNAGIMTTWGGYWGATY